MRRGTKPEWHRGGYGSCSAIRQAARRCRGTVGAAELVEQVVTRAIRPWHTPPPRFARVPLPLQRDDRLTAASRCPPRSPRAWSSARSARRPCPSRSTRNLVKFHLIAFDAEQARRLVLQPLEQRIGVGAVDVDLGEHRKGDVVGQRAEIRDLGRVARLLRAELVAGKAEHLEAARAIFAVQRLQPLVLRREAAFRRGVDDQQHLAAHSSSRSTSEPSAARTVHVGDRAHVRSPLLSRCVEVRLHARPFAGDDRIDDDVAHAPVAIT